MKIREMMLPGTTSPEPQEYEIRHRALAREAAAGGMVLLKNEGSLLPVSTDRKIALYGAGAAHTIKGGTGSGDVNCRETVSILQGLKEAGYEVTTGAWLDRYEEGGTDNIALSKPFFLSSLSSVCKTRRWNSVIWNSPSPQRAKAQGVKY